MMDALVGALVGFVAALAVLLAAHARAWR